MLFMFSFIFENRYLPLSSGFESEIYLRFTYAATPANLLTASQPPTFQSLHIQIPGKEISLGVKPDTMLSNFKTQIVIGIGNLIFL